MLGEMDDQAKPTVSRTLAIRFELVAIIALSVSTIARGLLTTSRPSFKLSAYDWRESLISSINLAGFALIVIFVIWSSGDQMEEFGIRKWRWNIDPAYFFIALGSMFAIHSVYDLLTYGHIRMFGGYP